MSKRFTSESESDGPGDLDCRPIDTWLVSDRALLRQEGKYVERPVAIGISGARISRVISAEELRAGEAGGRAKQLGEAIIDVGAQPIVPAFVNGHSHLALAPLRGIASLARRTANVVTDTFFCFEKYLTPADVRVFARLGAFESALCGVGQVWDHYYFGEEVALALSEVGLGGVVAPTLQDISGPGSARYEEELEATLSIHANAQMKGAGIVAAVGPHASDTVSERLFERAGELARREGLPLHLHLAQSAEEASAGQARFRTGLSEVVLGGLDGAKVLLAHGLYLSDTEVEQLAKAGCVLAYCPYSQLQFGFLGPFSAWLRAGGGWSLGTDCVASNDALDVQRELPLAGGDAALLASFSRERRAFSASGASQRIGEIEAKRKSLLVEEGIAEPDRLLDGLFGFHLASLTSVPSGITQGGWAHLLVLNPDHPALFPGDDLARALAYGSTSGAISFSLMAGKVRGRSDGLNREILGSELYRDTLNEARRRREELLVRAAETVAASSS